MRWVSSGCSPSAASTGLWVAALAADVHLTQTYFVVAHFHYIMVGGMVSAYFGGLHYWWPKITGRMYPEMWARIAALIMFIGFNLTFFPQFVLGYLGMPRRYASYPPRVPGPERTVLGGRPPSSRPPISCRFPISSGRFSMGSGRPANPWRSPGLEWRTASPPPTVNFVETPVVSRGPYAFEDADKVTKHA